MTKRTLTIALMSLLLSVVVAFATEKNLKEDITMVSYEQSWSDRHGTLALKNNTNEEIKNVVFLITYLDMSGKEMDYEEFSTNVTIAPGMTKKLDIAAYEHERHYHFYKSQGLYDNTSFKVKFQLKDYNIEEEATESIEEIPFNTYNYNYEHSNEDNDPTPIIVIIGLFFFIGITVGLYVLVAVMAQKRNRNVVVWILLSLLATPLLMIIILLAIGKDRELIDNNYDEE